jgi:energy-converting hydrogenase Eha subunit E
MADYYPASGGPSGLYFGAPTDGSGDLVGMTDQSLLLNQQAYTFKAMSISAAAAVMNTNVRSQNYQVTMPGSSGLYLQYDHVSDRFIFINVSLTQSPHLLMKGHGCQPNLLQGVLLGYGPHEA